MTSPNTVLTYTGPTSFVHLHCHSIHSSLDGLASAQQYAQACQQRQYPAMAVTEHGNMASVPGMYMEFKKHKIKYIPGCEIYFNPYEDGYNPEGVPSRRAFAAAGGKLRELRKTDPYLYDRYARNRHLTVLAQNQTGFHNLVKLVTQASNYSFGAGRTKFPRVTWEQLCRFKEGLIVLSGCLNGPVAHELRLHQIKRFLKDADGNRLEPEVVWDYHDYGGERVRFNAAAKWLRLFKQEFGENYLVELQMPGIEGDVEVFHKLIALADHYKIELALANDSHYMERKDFILQKIMMAIAQNTVIDDPNLFHVNSSEQYFKTRAELWETFKTRGYANGIDDRVFERMCDNTLMIADRCTPLKIDDNPKIPVIQNDAEQLTQLVRERLLQLGKERISRRAIIDGRDVNYVQQAKIELDRFIDKGFASYFLITRDLVQFGRSKNWLFVPRGCTIPESTVTLADGGHKQIREIEIGEKVLDGFGNPQIVENKFIYDVDEDLVKIELDDGRIIAITIDHKLYVVRNGMVDLIRAGDLKHTDEIIDTCWERTGNHENH